MAKARKKAARKPVKRKAVPKRKAAAKSRRPAKTRARRAKAKTQESFVDAVREAAALRRRLGGANTFED
jgi:hypothetical protein